MTEQSAMTRPVEPMHVVAVTRADAPVVSFTVRGIAAPQGSKRHVGHGVMVESSKRLPDWRRAVATEARAAMGNRPLMTGPVLLVIDFVFPRPASHYLPANSKRPERVLRPDAPFLHTSKPDADKLLRAVMDACSKVVWLDDAQVCMPWPRKFYGEIPKATVEIEELAR